MPYFRNMSACPIEYSHLLKSIVKRGYTLIQAKQLLNYTARLITAYDRLALETNLHEYYTPEEIRYLISLIEKFDANAYDMQIHGGVPRSNKIHQTTAQTQPYPQPYPRNEGVIYK